MIQAKQNGNVCIFLAFFVSIFLLSTSLEALLLSRNHFEINDKSINQWNKSLPRINFHGSTFKAFCGTICVAFSLCCVLFILHIFRVTLFSCCLFTVFHFFHVGHLSCWTLSYLFLRVLYSFHPALSLIFIRTGFLPKASELLPLFSRAV